MKLTKNNVAVAVGVYDTLVGLWPLVAPNTFIRATGDKNSLQAGKIIGGMWASLGIALLLFSSNRKVIPVLGVASTLAGSSLALTQLGLVSAQKLPSSFLLQALAETLIGATWICTLTTDKKD